MIVHKPTKETAIQIAERLATVFNHKSSKASNTTSVKRINFQKYINLYQKQIHEKTCKLRPKLT